MSDDVQAAHGVVLSVAAANFLVSALDELVRLGTQRGAAPSPRLATVRRDLAACCTREIARVNASAEVVAALDVLAWDQGAVIDAKTAARMLDMTPDGVRWLCKNRRLGTKVNGHWVISAEAVEQYRESKG